MSALQAIRYFVGQAWVNLLRSWRISLLAISTIGVSLFIGGTFLLVLGNLSQLVGAWRQGAKVVVYLERGVTVAQAGELTTLIRQAPWVEGVTAVTAEDAAARFKESFPSLADLLEGWSSQPLPASFEIAFDPLKAGGADFDAWATALRARPEVAVVDDDRDWVAQLETVLQVMAGLGLVLGGVLLGAAIFTTASVIRLTAHLYREEIAIMRLVGATEFFIRGPFYTEGLLQGALGGVLALGGLLAVFAGLTPESGSSLVAFAVARTFLPAPQQALMVGVGALSGLFGAILSLRRERLA